MCQSGSEVCAKRELKIGGGKILQCLLCRRVGVEFGTSYLVFDESEFDGFASWFSQLDSTSPRQNNRFLIQIQGSSGMMLSLAPSEMRSLSMLLSQGRRWLMEGSVGAPRQPATEMAVGEWVH